MISTASQNLPRRSVFAVFVATAALAVAGCARPAATSPADGPIQVLCTTAMVADVVKAVGGPRVEVTTLMGPGVDPHLYKASTGDILQLDRAQLVFYSGIHLEGKLTQVLEKLAARKPTVAVASALPADRLLHAEEGAHDPHVWFDVALWSRTAPLVAQTLAKFDPAHAADYEARATRYVEQLEQLDAWSRQQIATIPPERRVLVTAHDAFGYFGRAYDLEVRSVQGLSTESEAGVRRINELVDFIVSRGVKAVFIETTLNERNVLALVEGCAARGQQVKIGGELFSDAMGAAGTPEGTYEGMVRHNVNTIVQALR
jgi:manganese/zinc/iron transport system substrate-binding protein